MKKVFFFLSICSLFVLFSYKDYGVCAVNSGQKALVCGSCHGGSSVSNGVFIIDGKEDDEEETNDYVVSVRIPSSDLSYIQFSTEAISNTVKPTIDINFASLIRDFKGSSLFTPINLSQKSLQSQNGFIETEIHVNFNEAITEPQDFILQGVLSNRDGSPKGDKSFYTTFTIQPKSKKEESTISKVRNDSYSKSYFNANTLHIQQDNSLMQVFDLQGKLVHKQFMIDKGIIPVDFLPNGTYWINSSVNGKVFESYAFVK